MDLRKITPDIPCPRPDDQEFNKLVRRWLDTKDDFYDMRGQRDTWRKAFYAVAAMLFTFLIVLLVLFGSKLFTLHSSLFI